MKELAVFHPSVHDSRSGQARPAIRKRRAGTPAKSGNGSTTTFCHDFTLNQSC